MRHIRKEGTLCMVGIFGVTFCLFQTFHGIHTFGKVCNDNDVAYRIIKIIINFINRKRAVG